LIFNWILEIHFKIAFDTNLQIKCDNMGTKLYKKFFWD